QPRQLAQLDVPAASPQASPAELELLQLPPPLVVVGAVRGPDSRGKLQPVASAAVDVYAISSAGSSAVLLGSAVTDSSGQYRVVLPDVSQPFAVKTAGGK